MITTLHLINQHCRLLAIHYFLLPIFCLLLYTTAFAQYRGGKADGFAITEVKNVQLEVSTIEKESTISIYPNPAKGSDIITVKIKDISLSKAFYQITDEAGRVVMEGNFNVKTSLEIAAGSLKAGSFLLSFPDNPKRKPLKFVVD